MSSKNSGAHVAARTQSTKYSKEEMSQLTEEVRQLEAELKTLQRQYNALRKQGNNAAADKVKQAASRLGSGLGELLLDLAEEIPLAGTAVKWLRKLV